MKNDFLVDTHCHLHDLEWFTPEQQAEFLEKAHANNVQKIICIGTNHEDSINACNFAKKHDGVYWTYGVHPEFASEYAVSKPDKLDKLVAIGEIGLDYHYEPYSREAQIRLFEEMLQLARDLKLPVSLHIREAFDDAFPILDNFPDIKGVVHSFTSSKKNLKKALERDFYIGVNGLATYSTIPLPPLEKIVLETDAPFLTPVPFRGTINTPGYIKNIAMYLSGKMGEAENKIVEQTTKNARTVFEI